MVSAGFEPANLGTKGQHATPRPPKPLQTPFIIHHCKINRNGGSTFERSKFLSNGYCNPLPPAVLHLHPVVTLARSTSCTAILTVTVQTELSYMHVALSGLFEDAFLCCVRDRWRSEHGALMQWYARQETEVFGEKPVPMSLCPLD
jgi:hypothetical protein